MSDGITYLPQTEERRARHKVPAIRDLALQDTERAYARIVWLMENSPHHKIQLEAAIHVLNRGHGHAPRELTINAGASSETEELKLRRQALRLMGESPEHLREVFKLMRETGMMVDPDAPVVEEAPVRVEVEVTLGPVPPAVIDPPKEEVDQPCFCAHDVKSHPGFGPCTLCPPIGRICNLFSDAEKAEEVREEARQQNGSGA